LIGLYSFLIRLRAAHPALQSPNFYPDYYDSSWVQFSPDGYGIDEARQVAIYHRWNGGDLYMVVLNFSDSVQYVDVPLPQNGNWIDLLNTNNLFNVQNYRIDKCAVPSNWGYILHLGI